MQGRGFHGNGGNGGNGNGGNGGNGGKGCNGSNGSGGYKDWYKRSMYHGFKVRMAQSRIREGSEPENGEALLPVTTTIRNRNPDRFCFSRLTYILSTDR